MEELRDGCGLLGMRTLQFAFGNDATNVFLPHNDVRHTVCCAAAPTTATPRERERIYTGIDLAADRWKS